MVFYLRPWKLLLASRNVDSDDKQKTAFSTHFETYKFKDMPFGLFNASNTFQKLMEIVLAGLH